MSRSPSLRERQALRRSHGQREAPAIPVVTVDEDEVGLAGGDAEGDQGPTPWIRQIAGEAPEGIIFARHLRAGAARPLTNIEDGVERGTCQTTRVDLGIAGLRRRPLKDPLRRRAATAARSAGRARPGGGATESSAL